MNRKAYVRVTERFTHLAEPLEVIAGVELRPVHSLTSQYTKLRGLMKVALAPSVLRNYSDEAIAASIELVIQANYPESSSYFIEVGRGNLDQYVQVFEEGD